MHILSIIGGAGAIQGVVVLISILLRFRNRKNIPLAILLVVFSLRLATIPTWSESFLIRFPWIFPVTAPLPVLFAPLLWWYIRESINKIPARPPLFILHWLPFILLFVVLTCITALMDRHQFEFFVYSLFSGKPPGWFTIQNGMKIFINSVYMVLAVRLVFGSGIQHISRQKRVWLRALVLLPSLVFSFYCYIALNPAASESLSEGNIPPFRILAVTMLIFIYLIAFLFMFTPGFAMIRYERSGSHKKPLYSDQECREIMNLVDQKMNDGIFTNPDLTLSDCASFLGIHPNRLSFAINRCAGISFKSLINTRRLDYFCKKASTGYLRDHSILFLAFESGFPSKSIFNRVFNEQFGMSPSAYVNIHRS